jgi:hypothetical protein
MDEPTTLHLEASATVERAAAQDVPAIRELLRETWHDAYASLLPKTAIETVTSQWYAPALLAEQIQNPDIYFAIARDEGVVAGVVGRCWSRVGAHSVTLRRSS